MIEKFKSRLAGIPLPVFPYVAPQAAALPFIVYSMIDDVPQGALHRQGRDGLFRARFQVDCYARTAIKAESVFDSVRNALVSSDILLESSRGLYEDSTETYRVSGDFFFWHSR